MFETFFDFFPVPKFIDPPFAGLSISDKSILFVSFSRHGSDNLILKGFDRVDLPDGIVQNGDIINPEKLVEILSEFRKKNDLSFVKVSLPEEKAFLFRASIPRMSHQEAKEALQFKIEENVPISANEAIFDFYTMSDGSMEDKVVVSALPQKVAFDYLEVLSKSGFQTIAFEVESQSIAKAVIKDGDQSPFLIVNIEKEHVGLFAVEKGLVQFTSTIDLEKDFFKSVHESFGSDLEENKSKQPGVSEAIDNSGVITIRGDQRGDRKLLKDEIEKLISYWSSFGISNNSSFKIEKIIACGDVVLEPGFKKYFTENFDLPMEPANVWANAFSLEDYVPDLDYKESLKYAVSVGLALPFLKKKKQQKVSSVKKNKKKNV